MNSPSILFRTLGRRDSPEPDMFTFNSDDGDKVELINTEDEEESDNDRKEEDSEGRAV